MKNKILLAFSIMLTLQLPVLSQKAEIYSKQVYSKIQFGYRVDGKDITRAEFEVAGEFNNGYAAVLNWNSWGIIDIEGQQRLYGLEGAVVLNNGTALVKDHLTWKIIDIKSGVELDWTLQQGIFEALAIQAKDNYALNADIVVTLEKKEKWGAVSLSGKEIIPFKNQMLKPIGTMRSVEDEANFLLLKKKKYAIVDSDLNRIMKVKNKSFLGYFSGKFYYEENGKLYSLMEDENNGQQVSSDDPVFKSESNLRSFNDKIISLDPSNKKPKQLAYVAISKEFKFKETAFKIVWDGQKYGLIDQDMNEVMPVKYESLTVERSNDYKVKFLLAKEGSNYHVFTYDGATTAFKQLDTKEYTAPYYLIADYDHAPHLAGLLDDKGQYLRWNKGDLSESSFGDQVHIRGTADGNFDIYSGDKKISIKSYDLLEDFREEQMFIAQNNDGTSTYINLKGEELFTGDIGSFYRFTGTEGAYLVGKGKEWAIFSRDKKIHIPFNHFVGSTSNFSIDTEVYEAVRDKYLVKKNGKIGVIKSNGEMELPYQYDELHEFLHDAFDEEGETYWVAKKGAQWMTLDAKYQELKKIDVDYWMGDITTTINDLGEEQNLGLAIKKGKTVYYNKNWDVVETVNFTDNVNLIWHEGIQGAVDALGNVLYDFGDHTIRRHSHTYTGIYIVSKGNKEAYFDENMKELIPMKYDGLDVVCSNKLTYFGLYKDDKAALVYTNSEKGEFKILSEFIYTDFSCIGGTDPKAKKAFCKAKKNGQEVYLNIEGKEVSK